MAQNRGKQFEDVVRDSFKKVPDTSVVRLPDPVMGYLGYRNICDFIVYHYPHQYFIECKSCHGTSFPFSNITSNQRKGLLEQSCINGVQAGVLIWFIDKDVTVWVPISTIRGLEQQGRKSLNWKLAIEITSCRQIIGTKKRVFFDYDMEDFLCSTQR